MASRGANDLCPGYQPNKTGLSGRCSCGLHWDGHMPPHDRKGRLIPPYVLERELKRNGRRLEVDLRRARERAEMEPLVYWGGARRAS